MVDKQTERALASLRNRHAAEALRCAERIRENVGYLITRLETGQSPAGFSLVDDAMEIAKRVAVLDAIGDTVGIYEADGK
jgi:hypothetical protein